MLNKSKNDIILNSKQPIPSISGNNILRDDLRPPPKILTYHKSTFGYTPKKVNQMLRAQKEYERQCEIIEATRDLIEFEMRQNPSKKLKLPEYPDRPNVDSAIINAFNPPDEKKFYDYPIPSNPMKTRHVHSKAEHHMARGCPSCNPTKYNSIKSRTAPSSSLQTTRDYSQLDPPPPDPFHSTPYQIGNSFWNMLDETTVPVKPSTIEFITPKKRPQFTKNKIGPRPAGIPIVYDEILTVNKHANEKFAKEMSRKEDMELQKREKLLKTRVEISRNAMEKRREEVRALSSMSGQKWFGDRNNAGEKTSRRKKTNTNSINNQTKKMSDDDIETLKSFNEFEKKRYQEFKESMKPKSKLERLMQDTGIQ